MDFLATLRERVVVADGAMGTFLFSQGVPLGNCLEELNLSRPSCVTQVHAEYRAAGAELLQTNTFGANAVRLAAHGLETKVAEINRAGVRLARAAADGSAWVAGSVGPLGGGAADNARDSFREQIAALADAGADLILLETFRDLSELGKALAVARSVCELPLVAQVSPDEDGNLLDGIAPGEFMRKLAQWGADVIGCNCGIGPKGIAATVQRVASLGDLPLAAQPSAGLPVEVAGRLHYPCSPDEFAGVVAALVDHGVRLIGGCCGTTPDHIRAVRRALDAALRPYGLLQTGAAS
jgi:homocysteine S-methyltransferase